MAIVWGTPEGSSNEKVGIEVTMSPSSVSSSTSSVTLSVKVYAYSQYSISDTQNYSLGGAISGSGTFNMTSSGVNVLIASRSISVDTVYGSSVSRSFSASISGHYGGATPSVSTSFTVLARPASAPGASPAPTISSITATSARAAWTSTPAQANGSSIDQWQVQASAYSDFRSTTYSNSDASTPQTMTGLAPATTYYVRVRGHNTAGWGAWSGSRSFKTTADTPAAPSTPTVSADVVSASASCSAPNNGGSSITGYTFQIATNSSFTSGARTFSSPSTSVTLSGLDPATTYYVRVRATNAIGAGDWSGARSFTTLSGVRVWSGSSWVDKPLRRWNGSQWVVVVLRRWNGTAWVS